METNQIINLLGGTSKVAELCNVTVGAVSQWRRQGIPAARLMFLKLLRPDLFAGEQGGDRDIRDEQKKEAA